MGAVAGAAPVSLTRHVSVALVVLPGRHIPMGHRGVGGPGVGVLMGHAADSARAHVGIWIRRSSVRMARGGLSEEAQAGETRPALASSVGELAERTASVRLTYGCVSNARCPARRGLRIVDPLHVLRETRSWPGYSEC